MNGDKKENKTFKAALKSVIAPLLIVIRREQKETNKKLDDLKESRPEVQKTEVTNLQKEIEVTNFPKQIKAEITNPQKEVEVKGIAGYFRDVTKTVGASFTKSITYLVDETRKGFKDLKDNTFKVTVTNQKDVKFPKVQDVALKELDQILEALKQRVVQRVKIENSTPGEAIPVVLTNKDKRRFYDTLLQITGGTNLDNVKRKLDEIITVLENLDVTINAGDIQIGAVELKDETTDDRVNVATDSTKKAVFVQSESLASETTLAAIKAVTDLLAFVGDRLKVDAVITLTPNPRPGLRVAEFLKESGGSSAVNVDGSVTPVTFSAAPPTGKKWFIHSITLVIEDTSINFKKFGGIAALTNGIEIKAKEGGLAEVTLGTFKTNGDFHAFTTDIRLDSAATDFLTVNANIKQNTGTTLELADANSEILKVIVNDDLTTLDRFNVLIKGFEVAE